MTVLRIDPAAEFPPYEQLRRQLIDQIQTGQLPGETRLPAVRRLAADLGIAPGTVARAYKELEAEGFLIARGRHGTIVAPDAGRDPIEQGRRLTQEYVAAMQQLGFDREAIVHAIHSSTEHH